MKRPRTVHCFFEQSGTFKNQFRSLGIDAYDYDIQDEYGETDYKIDLFVEFCKAFEGGASVFDNISKDDLIIAFFPCIYFSALSQMAMYFNCINYRTLDATQKGRAILERSAHREEFFAHAVRMFTVCLDRGLKLIMENPWSEQTFLKWNFVCAPSYIDPDRSKRGDYFKKPTAYWFLNCEPCNGYTLQPRSHGTILKARPSMQAGICSQARSEISPEYAYNFICDNILGCANRNEKQLRLDFF